MLKYYWMKLVRHHREDPWLLPLYSVFLLVPFLVKPLYKLLYWLSTLVL